MLEHPAKTTVIKINTALRIRTLLPW